MFAACSLGMLGGCGIFGEAPTVAEGATFRGPPMELDSSGRVHTLTMRAPNPGWDLVFDRSDAAPGTTRAFYSAVRPDPTFLYVQQVVSKSAASDVGAGEGVEVFARIIDHDQRRNYPSYSRVLLGLGAE